MSYTPKKENVTKAELTGFGFTMKSGNENDYPIAYVHSIWDVIPSSGKASLVSLLGATGQYSQEEINKAVADKLAELSTNVNKVTSAGKYHKRPQSSDNSENTFDSLATLNAYQQDSNYTANVQVSDYALTKIYSYVETEDTLAQSGKTYYANAQGGALDPQPTEGADISNSGYYEKVVSGYDRYHWSGNAWILDYTLQKTLFEDAEWTAIGKGNIDNTLMQKLSDLPTAEILAELLATKQNVIDSSHKLDADLVDDEDGLHKFVSAQNKIDWNAKYNKPSEGIPSSDMTSAVQASLGLANTAEQAANKKTVINNNSTNTDYPSALAVKTYVDDAVSTNKATFRGEFESVADLPDTTDIPLLKAHDYAYVHLVDPNDETGNPEINVYEYVEAEPAAITIDGVVYTRDSENDATGGGTAPYCWTNGTNHFYTKTDTPEARGANEPSDSNTAYDNPAYSIANSTTIVAASAYSAAHWEKQYTLNNSGYTASQWTAINSGIDADAAAWAKSEYEKNVMTKAYERYKLTQQYVSGSSIDVDNATGSVELAIRVKIEYKYGDTGTNSKDWVIVKALNHDALTTAGWERETTGTYAGWYKKTADNDSTITISAKVPTLTADTIAAQAFTYKPNQTDLDAVPTTQIPSDKRNTEFLGKTLSRNSEAKTTTMNWPYYYGWSTISGTTNMAALKESLTRVSKKSDVPTKQLSNGIVPGDTDVAMYFWVIRSTSGTCTMNQNNNTVSCVHPDYKGITVAVTNNNKELNYKAWRTNSFAGAATNIGEITITVS